jgi:hypothetical protein
MSWEMSTFSSLFLPLPIKLANLSRSHFTSYLSSSLFLPMSESHVSTLTFSLQDGEQDSSTKSIQEVEASTLEIGIMQGINPYLGMSPLGHVHVSSANTCAMLCDHFGCTPTMCTMSGWSAVGKKAYWGRSRRRPM